MLSENVEYFSTFDYFDLDIVVTLSAPQVRIPCDTNTILEFGRTVATDAKTDHP
jgi:hypothetical protein